MNHVNVSTRLVLTNTATERMRQDEKWGGAENDDGHDRAAWLDLIGRRLNTISKNTSDYKSSQTRPLTVDDRQLFVEIAALATAAVESIDRREPPVTEAIETNPLIDGPGEALLLLTCRIRELLKLWDLGFRGGQALVDAIENLRRELAICVSPDDPACSPPIPASIGVMQDRVAGWARDTFPRHTALSIIAHLQEEVLELMQVQLRLKSTGIEREIGGVGVLLLTLCDYLELSFADCLSQELQRNEVSDWVTDESGMTHRAKPPAISE